MVRKPQLLQTLFISSLLWQLSLQFSSLPTDASYSAGVVEFRASNSTSTADRVADNLSGYLKIIASKSAAATDIIIFPEGTLNNDNELSYVPDPAAAALLAPCDYVNRSSIYHQFLAQLSCAARKTAKYLVINISEKEDCLTPPADPRPCSTAGFNVFNTNVVFDREGRVISRYRKVHLYGENKNVTFLPASGEFDTDFGVRFGHFICFDILFYAPAQQMVDEHEIRDFIYPTKWFSQLPFLTGVQTPAAWSFANNVNLLSAGASNPTIGATGSGIYAGRAGTLVAAATQHGTGKRKLHVAHVPKIAAPSHQTRRSVATSRKHSPAAAKHLNQNDIFLKRDYLENYASVVVDLSQGNSLQQEVCYNNSLCCHFELSWQHLKVANNSQYYSYRLGAYDGWRNAEGYELNKIKNCAVFACIGADITDCGKVFPADVGANVVQPQVSFSRIVIEAAYPKSEAFVLSPNSLKDDLLPLSVREFQWNETIVGLTHNVRYILNTTTDNLLTFAIYGNYFDDRAADERPEDHRDSAAVVAGSVGVLLLVFTAFTVGCLMNI